MPTLFVPLIGRLGNILFIYSHARAWCEQNGHTLCTFPWIGEKVFEIPEAKRPSNDGLAWPERMYQHQRDLIYTRKQVREWFTFKPDVLERLQPATCKSEVLLNLRQGRDYTDAGLVTISHDSYADACRSAGYDPIRAGIESDVAPTRLPDFNGNPDASGLGVTDVVLPSFYRLMTAPVLFRANSTFSFWASVLADNQIVYSPIIKGVRGGIPNQRCDNFVEGNWPQMVQSPDHSDLHLKEE